MKLRELTVRGSEPIDYRKLDPDMMRRLGELAGISAKEKERDWANLCRFKAENAEIRRSGVRPRIVLIGDSITENWQLADPALFSREIVDRGIGGQTSSQLLVRFSADVLALRPTMVHLMAGTNDIGLAASPIDDDDYINNMAAMIDLAKRHRVKVVLASIPPARKFLTSQVKPADRIIRLNARLRKLAREKGVAFADYHSVLAAEDGGMRAGMSNDEVHPNLVAYGRMRPIFERAAGLPRGK